jgi:hypothetical protein
LVRHRGGAAQAAPASAVTAKRRKPMIGKSGVVRGDVNKEALQNLFGSTSELQWNDYAILSA